MKKKCILLMTIVISMAGLIAACGNQPVEGDEGQYTPLNGNSSVFADNGDDAENDPATNEPNEIFSGQIVSIPGDSILLMDADGMAGSLYLQSLAPLELKGLDGKSITAKEIKPGMTVDISFSGMVMKSYPAQLAGASSLQVTGEKDNILGFYMELVHDIYAVDPGLNGGIEMIVLDFTEIENLTSAEKSAFIYLVGNEYGYMAYEDTYDGLVEKGLIKDLYFEKGILISFSNMTFKKNGFSFDLTKWRSGLGAYVFMDCDAKKDANGTWTYEVGSHAIS
jgi:hypothetical protein